MLRATLIAALVLSGVAVAEDSPLVALAKRTNRKASKTPVITNQNLSDRYRDSAPAAETPRSTSQSQTAAPSTAAAAAPAPAAKPAPTGARIAATPATVYPTTTVQNFAPSSSAQNMGPQSTARAVEPTSGARGYVPSSSANTVAPASTARNADPQRPPQ